VPVSGKRIGKALARLGWKLIGVSGSHHLDADPSRPDHTVTVPIHGN
jgi:predicted RNA binding protein YcfA (HicA-like mRNA interferase family)